jgi:hypothetical protein
MHHVSAMQKQMWPKVREYFQERLTLAQKVLTKAAWVSFACIICTAGLRRQGGWGFGVGRAGGRGVLLGKAYTGSEGAHKGGLGECVCTTPYDCRLGPEGGGVW